MVDKLKLGRLYDNERGVRCLAVGGRFILYRGQTGGTLAELEPGDIAGFEDSKAAWAAFNEDGQYGPCPYPGVHGFTAEDD